MKQNQQLHMFNVLPGLAHDINIIIKIIILTRIAATVRSNVVVDLLIFLNFIIIINIIRNIIN